MAAESNSKGGPCPNYTILAWFSLPRQRAVSRIFGGLSHMSDPFSEMPGMPRPTRRRFEPGLVQEALQALRETAGPAISAIKRALGRAQRTTQEGFRRANRYGQELWRRAKRNPRNFGFVGAAIVVALVGAYAVSASMSDRSLCPAPAKGKTPKFRLLMDPVTQVKAGSQVEIHYDVCGLASGSPYRGRVRLVQQQQRTAGKKRSASPTPLVVSFKDRVDGPATRREQELKLGSTKPGTYTLELVVADGRGRERKRTQKIVIKGK